MDISNKQHKEISIISIMHFLIILFYTSIASANVNCPFETSVFLNKQTILSGNHNNAVVNLFPAIDGHVMIVPKRCINNFTQLNTQELTEAAEMVEVISQAFKSIYDKTDYIILQKNGVSAGQSIDHLHFHIIPTKGEQRYEIIKKTFNLTEREQYSVEELNNHVNKFRTFFSKNQTKFWPSNQYTRKHENTDKKEYTHVLLDLGNVLINANEDGNSLSDQLKIPVGNVSSAVTGKDYHKQYCRGQITSDQYYNLVLQNLDGYIKPETLSSSKLKQLLANDIYGYDPKVLELVNRFKKLGKKIIVVTDTHEWQSERFRSIINFDNYAHEVFESHIFGKLKNDSDYFSTLLHRLNIHGDQAVLIDDKLANNVLASKQGIFAPGFSSAKQVTEILENSGYL